MINRLMWIWRGVDPWEIEDVLSRIAASKADRSNEQLLDTVIGYRGGNWIYEWAKQGADWQQRAIESGIDAQTGQFWLNAANLYSIAAYPHIKGDELAEQAQTLANRAYEEAAKYLPYELRELTFPITGGGTLTGFCICHRRVRHLSLPSLCAAVWKCCRVIIIACFRTILRQRAWRC